MGLIREGLLYRFFTVYSVYSFSGIRTISSPGSSRRPDGGAERTLANSRSHVHKFANCKARRHFQTIEYFWRHVTSCLPESSPNRHFEGREDPGDEVVNTVNRTYPKVVLHGQRFVQLVSQRFKSCVVALRDQECYTVQ